MSELERLRDRVAELEDAMGLTAEIPRGVVPREFARDRRAGPKVLACIGILLRRPFADRDAIFDGLYGLLPDADRPNLKVVDVYLSFARRALKSHDIELHTIWGRGWYLDNKGKAQLHAVIERLNNQRAAA